MASTQEYANLAEHAYKDLAVGVRSPDRPEKLTIGGHDYYVLEHASNPQTGYQGTIYQDINSGEIIVAHRGTKDGTDIGADIDMVRSKTNNQINDAMRLVEHAKTHAEQWHDKNPNQPYPALSTTGHSLGGTLAEVTAYRQNLHGET